MTSSRPSNSFGIDPAIIKKIDWHLAVSRIIYDSKSDFIYAPHLRFIYSKAQNGLIDYVKRELSAGNYSISSPLTIDVPKSSRVRISKSKRLGPNFTRPGSILMPQDRLLYQVMGDESSEIIDQNLDKSRSFSHILDPDNKEHMFLPTRECWNNLQKAMARHANDAEVTHVLKIDVANYFGSINQHTLVNILADAGYESSLTNRLEEVLLGLSGSRSSRGILQGLYTSDLIGNFYMMPIDRFISECGVPSARYVDDVYIFVKSYDEADRIFNALQSEMRSYDLIFNEAKTYILPKNLLVTEEPDLENLFEGAIKEISDQIKGEEVSDDYGFQMDWEDEDLFEDQESADDDDEEGNEDADEDVELRATELLFDSVSDYPGHEESIERFCIPIFQRVGSEYAIEYVKIFFDDRPSMTQIYASYLSNFVDREDVSVFLIRELGNDVYSDWQCMWILAALLQSADIDQSAVRSAYSLLTDANRHEGLRAVAAIFVGKFGDFARRRSLISFYPRCSEYLKSAIYFSTMYWGTVEKRTARSSWGAQGLLNRLITEGFEKRTKRS